jgi:hypothetical protein
MIVKSLTDRPTINNEFLITAKQRERSDTNRSEANWSRHECRRCTTSSDTFPEIAIDVWKAQTTLMDWPNSNGRAQFALFNTMEVLLTWSKLNLIRAQGERLFNLAMLHSQMQSISPLNRVHWFEEPTKRNHNQNFRQERQCRDSKERENSAKTECESSWYHPGDYLCAFSCLPSVEETRWNSGHPKMVQITAPTRRSIRFERLSR